MPLQPPPLDADGKVVPHDDQGILAADILIRRISAQHITGEEGNRRISSMAFQESSDGTGMSIDISKLIEEAGLEPRSYVTSDQFFCSVQFSAQALRAEQLRVGYYPLVSNPYHGAVWSGGTRADRRRMQRQLQTIAQWFVQADGITLGNAA